MSEKKVFQRIEGSKSVFQELGRHLFESSVIPMIMVDTDGIIVKVNSAYEKFTGLSTAELVGNYMPDKVEGCRTHIVAKTGIAELHQIQHTFGRTILSTRLPIFDEVGNLVGAWGMVDVNNFAGIIALQQQIEQQKNRISQYEKELQSLTLAKYTLEDIRGNSSAIHHARGDAFTAAQAQIDVVIRGETGTGKELFAHAIHSAGHRAKGPFISINCSALSPGLVESELFGYEGGAFTDANKKGQQGKFEFANGGTLFLDEIGDMPISIQPKLLRAIEAREITRVGGQKAIPLDIQIIAATNCDLESMVDQGMFRRDLYYRLSVYVVNVPPLRARQADIPILAKHFAEDTCRKIGRKCLAFSDECMDNMLCYSWPGNVRELYNHVRNIVIRSQPDGFYFSANVPLIEQTQLKSVIEIGKTNTLISYEEKALRQALQISRGNISKTAEILQVDRNTVYRKMKKYGLSKMDY